MFKFDAIARFVTVAVGTIVLSSVCVLGAVGPAQADASPIIQTAVGIVA